MTTKLVKKETVAKETVAFYFERPDGFSFKPGQYIDIELLDQDTGVDDDKYHSFSIASTPSDPHLMITTRMRETKFKNKLNEAKAGYEVGLSGPNGSFLLHNDPTKTAVMLAGGIGITPFHSMIFDAVVHKPNHTIYLFYSDSHPDEFAFKDELESLTKSYSNFKLTETVTKLDTSDQWSGETGRIDKAMLTKHLPSFSTTIFYAAGSQNFVNAMRAMLNAAGVDDDNIRTEDFPGY